MAGEISAGCRLLPTLSLLPSGVRSAPPTASSPSFLHNGGRVGQGEEGGAGRTGSDQMARVRNRLSVTGISLGTGPWNFSAVPLAWR